MERNGNLLVCQSTPGCAIPLWTSNTSHYNLNQGAFLKLERYGALNLIAKTKANPSISTSTNENENEILWGTDTMRAAGCSSRDNACKTILVIDDEGDVLLKRQLADGALPCVAVRCRALPCAQCALIRRHDRCMMCMPCNYLALCM